MPDDDYTRALFAATEAARATGVTFSVKTLIKPEPHRELTIWLPLAEDWQRVALRILGAIHDVYTDDDSALVGVKESRDDRDEGRRRGKGRAKARADGGREARG